MRARVLVPTPEGLATLVIGGFLFLLATNLMAGWLFFLVAFLAAALLVGAVSATRAVRGVRVEVGPVSPAVEGGQAVVSHTVRAARRVWFIRIAAGAGGSRGEAFLRTVARDAVHQAAVRFSAPQRGVHPVREVRVISLGLLGMFRAERALPAAGEVVVGPRYQLLPLLPVGSSGEEGMLVARRRRGSELGGIREFLPGDAARHIHWRSSARHGQLMVKEFEQPASPRLAVVVDAGRGQAPADLDAVARAAASILHTALAQGWEAAVLWEGAAGPTVVRGTWTQVWEALARVRADGPPLAQAHTHLVPLLPVGAIPVTVTARPATARGEAVVVGPAGSTAPWTFDDDGGVRCVAS